MLGGRWWVALGLVGALAVRADASPATAAAEQAFDKGRELMTAGLYSEACAAFDQSERLDPQIGTLYNLAGCWEKVGKLASAWTAYREVAQRDANATRRKAADEHARALAPRLPKLVIKAEAAPPGATITLNGGDVTKLVGIETPMDLGTYAVMVTAKGYQAWGGEAKVVEEGKLVTVVVPALTPGSGTVRPPEKKPPEKRPPVIAPPVAHATPEPPPLPAEPLAEPGAERPPNAHGTIAIVTAAGGGALVIGGLVAGVLARGKLDDAKAICGADKVCDTADEQMRANALTAASRTRGNISTGLVVAGAGALVASGILWWTGRRDEEPPRTTVVPIATPTTVGLTLTGSF